jgi:hypothetical protein
MNNTHTLSRPAESTPLLREQDELGENALVYAHYFLPGTGADWYVTEYDPIEDIIFGWAEVVPECGEWGYTSMSELEQISLPMKIRVGNEILISKYTMKVELDLHWNVRTMREVLAERNSR